MDNHYSEIDEVIQYIHNHIYDSLSLSKLAKYVAYSPYHFSRIFKERMGISPLYYVSSVRLQRAKQLLLDTNLSVRDISEEIGQQSLGTFTTRFNEKVGMPPSAYRQSTIHAGINLEALKNLNDWSDPIPVLKKEAIIEGKVHADTPVDGVILIGLFPKPIPEGLPHYGTLISSLGEFRIQGIKPGVYYLMATAVEWGMQAKDVLLPHQTLRTRSRKPIIVEAGSVSIHQVYLYPPRIDDPPILISLPLLMRQFLNRTKKL